MDREVRLLVRLGILVGALAAISLAISIVGQMIALVSNPTFAWVLVLAFLAAGIIWFFRNRKRVTERVLSVTTGMGPQAQSQSTGG